MNNIFTSQTTKMIILELRKTKENLLSSAQFSYWVNWGNSLEHFKENRIEHENNDYLLYTHHSHKPH
jgi:hypothetical protein